MNPGTILALMLVAGTAGGLFYSYHVGRTQGESICEAALLEAKLKQKQEELNNSQELNKIQQEQVGEAQAKLAKEIELNAKLSEDLSKTIQPSTVGCITPGMLDAIKDYRAKARSKNS